MLEAIRKHMVWMMWIILGLIIVTFLFFGIYPSSVSGRVAAKVNGDVITLDEWNRAYQNSLENLRQYIKGQIDDRLIKGLKSQALRELIRNRLLVQEAGRIGLRISDEELRTSIIKIPAFSQRGKFDQKAYEGYLSYINITPALFEEKQREYMLIQKLERLVQDSVEITDAEASAAAYKATNPKAKPADFEKNKAAFRQQMLMRKRADALSAYIRSLQNKAEIKMDESLVSS